MADHVLHRGNTLPYQATSFVGRRAELAEIGALLASSRRLVTLVGVGGIGKTRLAVQAAALWASTTDARAIFVDLAVLDAPELVETAILEAAGLFPSTGRSHLSKTIDHFASERALFVLDNCEHLAEEAARVAMELVSGCPRVQVLATSREQLGVPGEVIWSVPPLTLDPRTSTDEMSEAARLFTERLPAQAAKSLANSSTVERLVEQLDGIPLAIELAAAHAQRLASTAVPSLDLPAYENPHVRPGRHKTMCRSLDWSYGFLSPHEALLFSRLSVFVNGWTLEAAERVCADERLPEGLILEAMTALNDKSLVAVTRVGEHTRFRMLEPVRQYAEETAAATGDPILPLRHRSYFTDMARRADRERWAFDENGRSRLDEESPNLRAALDHACRHDTRDALRLAGSLAQYWRLRGRLREGADATGRALALPGGEDLAERALVLAMHSTLVFWLGRLEATHKSAEEAIEIAEVTGDVRAHAHALVRHATARMMMDPRGAQPMLERAAQMARTADDPVALADALSSLAMSYHWQDDYARMSDVAEAGDDVAGRIGFDAVLSWNLWGRGHRARLAGEVTTARRLAEEFTTLTFHEDTVGRSAAIEITVLVDAMSGDDPNRARVAVSAQIGRTVHEAARWGAGLLQHGLGMVELAADRPDAARACGQLLYEQERLGSGYLAWHAQEILMLAALTQGDHARARSHAETVLSVAEQLGNRRAVAVAIAGLARAALLTDDTPDAEAKAQEALLSCVEGEWWVDATTALEIIAIVAARRGQHDRAVRVFTGVRTFREERGLHRVPREDAFWTEQIDSAVAGLDDANRTAAESAGAAMSLPQLADYVRRGRGSKRDPSENPLGLTPMERRVAELAARGLPNQDIARELFIARGTVKSHMSHIFAKLGVGNRTELATVLGRVTGGWE